MPDETNPEGEPLENIIDKEDESEIQIESPKDGIEKAKTTIEKMSEILPKPSALVGSFISSMEHLAPLNALEDAVKMCIQAELAAQWMDIDNRQRGVHQPDNFSYSLMLPSLDRLGRYIDELYHKELGGLSGRALSSGTRSLLEEMTNLEKIVSQTRKILEKDQNKLKG